MNQVSWLIYLANVAGNLGGFLIFIGSVAILVGIVYFICACGFLSELGRWEENDAKIKAMKTFRDQRRNATLNIVLAAILWLCAAFMPSSNTVLAIAASQFGEQLMHTKTANLAEQALNSWLQKQITEVKVPAADAEKK